VLSINFSYIYFAIFNCSFNVILLHLWVGFYISISHSLWINLRLTEILLLVKNLHLGLYYFSQFLLSEHSGLILDIWVALNIRVALIRFYKNLCLLHTPSITKCNFYFLFFVSFFFSTFGVKKTIRYLLLHLSHAMHLRLICKSHKLWSHIKKLKKKNQELHTFSLWNWVHHDHFSCTKEGIC